jgi:UDP-N-acetylglucosamine--N-acetylmuramyl-(pentapeptide) pyrophosphoryl-undecaprenol N-acetylglucosamine transferase
MGGSLGAKSINETIEENIDVFKKNNLQLIWQTGKNYAANAAKVEEERMNIWTNAFIDKMENAYAAADVVVARAGAMTVAEMCVVGKPAIFVPFPFAAEDHQTANAMTLVNKNAALIVPDTEVRTRLIPELLELINREPLMKELEENISKLSNTNADEIIATEILKQINKK